MSVIAFTTEFNDATKLTTSNSSELSIIPVPRLREGSGWFPEFKRPLRLFQIHQASVARFGADALRLEPNLKDPAEFAPVDARGRREVPGHRILLRGRESRRLPSHLAWGVFDGLEEHLAGQADTPVHQEMPVFAALERART